MPAGDLRKWNGVDHLAELQNEVNTEEKRRSLSFPRSASAMATAVAMAATVLRSEEEEIYLPVLRALMPDLGESAAKEFPSSYLRRWGDPSLKLQSKLLKALHTGIRPESALRYGTAGPSPLPPSVSQAQILQRARSVPQRFWPGWITLLQRDLPVGPRILQATLSLAVLLPGHARADFTLQREALNLTSNDSSFAYLHRRLQPSARDTLMKAVLTLATYLDSHPAPVDYCRRRTLSLDGLLTSNIWRTLSDHQYGGDPTTARLYLAYRVTGSISEHTDRGGDGYYLLQNFIAATSESVLDELDQRARAFLAEAGMTEPLSWEPPTNLLGSTPYVWSQEIGTDPLLNSFIKRGLIDRPLLRQISERSVRPIGALLHGSDSFEAELRGLLDRGESVESMSIAMHRSQSMIRHHISRLGLPTPSGRKTPLDKEGLRERYVVQGLTAQAIADETGWSRNTIRRLLLVSGFIT
ncbi:hypothetical protein [Arthrobacter sp. JZ12]|uniref:hypothetical protein n=1 Tax=Arthrobacter sp. JZ12 TaxID=2654190 RepID=UPI002B49FA99|nr:hypothetical protein [Arthrobacter sp. JZ12]